ncbi:MAG TPA: methionyl-tRNA formyltransferase [Casimicrobiaceae bacterium]|nr:methionyl-tRNA formyltransferase [Casimicrobiaceae bacterium]
MRVGFAGTPPFAACALSAIDRHGSTIPLVLTQPDRPSGRGLATVPSAVKRYAIERGLPVHTPASLNAEAVQSALAETALDILVVAAYGVLLPPAVLAWPRYGCLNIHASLLPRWRGAAPIARAIAAGDATTGITIMQMDAGLDTGPIIARHAIAIDSRDTAGTLHDRLATLGADMIVDALARLARERRLQSAPQPAEGATYAAKIGRADALIDWSQDAHTLDRRIRALSPTPGAVAGWQGTPVKIRAAIPLDRPASGADERLGFERKARHEPGTVIAVNREGIDIACGPEGSPGVLRLTALQPAAGRTMSAQAFAAGRGMAPGRRFEAGR